MKKIIILLILISFFEANSQEWSPVKGKMMTRVGKTSHAKQCLARVS